METLAHRQASGLHIGVLIRVVTNHELGGMQLLAETMRRAWVASGHRVTTITTPLPDKIDRLDDEWGTTYFVGDKPAAYTRGWWRASLQTLLDIHKRDPFDVLATNGKTGYVYLDARRRLPPELRIPVVVITYGTIVSELRAQVAQARHRPLRAAKWLPRGVTYWGDDLRRLHLADHVTITSKAQAAELHRWLLVDQARMTVIPNGVNVQELTAAASQRDAVRANLGLSDHTHMVLILANLVHRKGQHHMLEALARQELRPYASSLRLVLAGAGPAEAALREQVAQLGLTDQVTFMGAIGTDKVPALLNASDIVALPSLTEGMPVSILEAMACSRPVVATPVGDIPEVIEDGVTGLLVPVADSQALALAIARLIREPELAHALGQRAHARIAAEYDQHTMTRRYEEVLRATAQQFPRSSSPSRSGWE